MHKNYLAIDIGASSGRHIVGWMENGVLRTEEVYRFPNSVRRATNLRCSTSCSIFSMSFFVNLSYIEKASLF